MPEVDLLRRWAVQLRRGEVSYRFGRPVEFTLPHLSALVALGAAAARLAGLVYRDIDEFYAQVHEQFTHGRRVPAAWT